MNSLVLVFLLLSLACALCSGVAVVKRYTTTMPLPGSQWVGGCIMDFEFAANSPEYRMLYSATIFTTMPLIMPMDSLLYSRCGVQEIFLTEAPPSFDDPFSPSVTRSKNILAPTPSSTSNTGAAYLKIIDGRGNLSLASFAPLTTTNRFVIRTT